jgi:hypothetical protein
LREAVVSEAELSALAASIQRAWESGRICSLIGRGARARVIRISRLLAAGRLDRERALRLARETEAAAYCFAPLPPGDVS